MSKARQLADNGASTPNRNMIINGAMNVAQRSTSETGIGASTSVEYQTVDRIAVAPNTSGRLTMTQTADGPSGFANCLKLACTTADTSIASGEYLLLQHKIEGQNLQRIKKGTSDAEQITISFYVKGNASATYALSLLDNDNNRSVSKLFAVTTSWNRIELNFPADTTGAFGDDTGAGLTLDFFLHGGSDYTGGTLATTWASTTNANRAVGISSFFDATSRTFFLTGLQMEIGSSATPFEHKTFAKDLAECQRYYYKAGPFPANDSFCCGFNGTTTTGQGVVPFPVTMRAEPTALEQQGTGANYRIAHTNTATNCNSVPIFDRATNQNSGVIFTVASGLTAGQGNDLRSIEASAFLAWSAEL